MPQIVIALGSNVADPDAAIQAAWCCCVQALQLDDPRLSDTWHFEPAEQASGGVFSNAVGVGATELGPHEALAALQAIEAHFGRDRASEGHHGARPLDLDIIDHDGARVSDERLQLPHPRLTSRQFVLKPLQQVASMWRHPTCGRTVSALLAALIVVSLGACQHAPPPPTPWSAVSRPSEPPALALRVSQVSDSAMLNAFYEALAAYEGGQFCAETMLTSAQRIDDHSLSTLAGARLVAIHAVYRIVETRSLGKHFPAVRKLVDRLYRAAPQSPETRFATAYLRWILVNAGDGKVAANELDPSVIRDLQASLKALAEKHPNFDGPGAFDAAQIKRTSIAVATLGTAASERPSAALSAASTASAASAASTESTASTESAKSARALEQRD